MKGFTYNLSELTEHFAEAVTWRRQLHRCPQPPWLEFFATGFVAEKLADWGYSLSLGKDIIAENKQLLPPADELWRQEYDRALAAGINEEYIKPAQGGFTGVVAVLKGALPGPVVAFRFDIDSNEVEESQAQSHRPAREGFVSANPGYAHMCGHDAHTAMGLLLAKYFSEHQDTLCGTVKFIFQPNEENLSGAVAMAEKGVVDDVDYLLGGHVGLNVTQTGHIALNVHSFMAMSRFEVTYTGRPAHAALRPDEGKNALLGACAAVNNLYAIARHSQGASRVNVGIMQAGTAWNVIPEQAYFRMETRGVTNEINEYMMRNAREIMEGAAKMYGLEVEIKPAAFGLAGQNYPDMVKVGTEVAKELASVENIWPECAFNASEDVTVFMDRIQKRGGQSLYAVFGTPTYGGHHNNDFDIDENVILNGAEFLAALYSRITSL